MRIFFLEMDITERQDTFLGINMRIIKLIFSISTWSNQLVIVLELQISYVYGNQIAASAILNITTKYNNSYLHFILCSGCLIAILYEAKGM